jgi:hypothetical protein
VHGHRAHVPASLPLFHKHQAHHTHCCAGKWDQGRFDAIVNGMTPFLRSCGYNLKKEVVFLPVAALYGHNVKDGIPPGVCDWYTGERASKRACMCE